MAHFAQPRNNELVQLRRRDIEIKMPMVDAIFAKCLRPGEERSLTYDERCTYFEIYLRNRKGWQQKMSREARGPQQCESASVHHALIGRRM